MSKHEFKVGDRVVGVGEYQKRNIDGVTGTVVNTQDNFYVKKHYGIKFDKDIGGHTLLGECAKGFGWWVPDENVRPLRNETIVIYRNGNEVIALDKSTGEKKVAKCSPDDKFDFKIGAELAFKRLLGLNKPAETKKDEEIEDDEIRVGDLVEIVDTGQMFTTAIHTLKKVVQDPELLGKYVYGDGLGYPKRRSLPERDFVVKALQDKVAYIAERYSHKGYLIRVDGLKKVKNKKGDF